MSAKLDPWVMAAVLVAATLRLARLADAPFWFDETITAEWVRAPWLVMLRQVVTDNHPPVYFVLLKAWSALAGTSELALRLPSAVASILCVPVIAVAARTVAGPKAMRWAAWLAALSPLLIHHGQEARAYAWIALLASFQLALLLRFLNGERDRLGAAFAISAALLAWSHYYSAVFVAAEIAALTLICSERWRAWLPAAAAAAVGASTALLAAVTLAHHGAGGGYELGIYAAAGVLWGMLTEYTLLPSSADLHASGVIAALPYLPAALIGGLCVLVAIWLGWRQLTQSTRWIAVLTLAAVIVVPYAISLLIAVGVHPRYATPALAPLLLLMAAAARDSIRPRLAHLALAGILGLMTIASARHLADPTHGREDVRAAALWLDQHVQPNEEVLVMSEEMAQLARFHWPDRNLRLYPQKRLTITPDNVGSIAAALPASPAHRTIYVLGREWVADPEQLLESELVRRYRSCGEAEVRGIRILCLSNEALVDTHSAGEPQPRAPS